MTSRYMVVQIDGKYAIYDTLQDTVLEMGIHSKGSAEQRIMDIGQEYYD
jgi:hypothetical protein